jgi:hypothetical protein
MMVLGLMDHSPKVTAPHSADEAPPAVLLKPQQRSAKRECDQGTWVLKGDVKMNSFAHCHLI